MIEINAGFKIGAPLPLDDRAYLSTEEMKNIDESVMPDYLLTINKDNGVVYIYDKNNEASEETGKFKAYSPKTTKDIKANVSVGGLEKDEIIPAGTSFDELVEKIANKYYPPVVSVTYTPNRTIYAYGDKLENQKIKITIIPKSLPVEGVKIYVNSQVVSTITEIPEDNVVEYTFDTLEETSLIKVGAYDSKSEGFSNPRRIEFISEMNYIGFIEFDGRDESLPITAEEVKALDVLTQNVKEISMSYTPSERIRFAKFTYAYPADYGPLEYLKLEGINYLSSSMERLEMTINGNPYYVYTMNDPSGFGNSSCYVEAA